MPAVSIVLAYLIGSVPFALLVARQWGTPDLRQMGSGNLGAANVLRASGVTAGVLVAVLDISKGAASVLLARRLSGSTGTSALAGLVAILGHVYPVWLRFQGGKGVATACGVFAMLAPSALAPAVVVFLAGAWVSRYISVGSVLASVTLPAVAYILNTPRPIMAAAASTAALIIFRHRSNLRRVWLGTERRIGARA